MYIRMYMCSDRISEQALCYACDGVDGLCCFCTGQSSSTRSSIKVTPGRVSKQNQSSPGIRDSLHLLAGETFIARSKSACIVMVLNNAQGRGCPGNTARGNGGAGGLWTCSLFTFLHADKPGRSTSLSPCLLREATHPPQSESKHGIGDSGLRTLDQGASSSTRPHKPQTTNGLCDFASSPWLLLPCRALLPPASLYRASSPLPPLHQQTPPLSLDAKPSSSRFRVLATAAIMASRRTTRSDRELGRAASNSIRGPAAGSRLAHTRQPPLGRPSSLRQQSSSLSVARGIPDRAGAASPADSISTANTGSKRKERDYESDVGGSVSVGVGGEETNITVVVRCRGRSQREIKENSAVVVQADGVKGKAVGLMLGPNALSNKSYIFDRVYSQAADQNMVFDDTVKPILDEVCFVGHFCLPFFSLCLSPPASLFSYSPSSSPT